MFKKIETVIDKFFSKEEKEEYDLFLQIKKNWDKKIAKEIKINAEVVDYKNEELTIKAKNPAWKNELVFFTEEIKKNFHLHL